MSLGNTCPSTRRAREVRADVTLDQILDMVAAIANIDRDPGYVEPILQTAFDGLRTAARPGVCDSAAMDWPSG